MSNTPSREAKKERQAGGRSNSPTRMPPDSVFYERIVPALLLSLGLITLLIILITIAILLHLVPYQ